MKFGSILMVGLTLLAGENVYAGGGYEELEQKLESKNPRDRETAVRELTSRATEDRAFHLLKKASLDSDTEVRAQAVFGLGRSGKKEALSTITNAFRDKNIRIRKTAITSAFLVAEGAAVKPVLKRLARETDRSLRSQILSAILGSQARREAARAECRLLEQVLSDRDVSIRKQAVSVLVEVGSPKEVAAALSRRIRVEKDASLLKYIVSQSGNLSDASAGKIAEALIPNGNDSLRRSAFDSLESLARKYPQDIARILSKFMSHSNESIAKMAIYAARKCNSSTVTKKLLRIAEKDGKINIRTAAINSLGFHATASRKIVSSLERFGNSPQAAIRYASVQALVGRSKNARYFEKLLNGKDPEIRAAAVQGLIQMQTRSSGKVFISILKKHSDASMRLLAARALGKYGWDKSCKKAISDASKKDRSPLVRSEAANILRSL